MPNIRIKIEYDGTDFVGWQYQKNGRSVQEEIEKAIRQIYQREIRVIGAGRTDAGVHARGQVANFNLDDINDLDRMIRSLNAILPEDVVILEAEEVHKDFNARYDAKARKYKYYVNQKPTALNRKYCWQVFQKLDLDSMEECAKKIIGEHKFQAFCKVDKDYHEHNCIVASAKWEKIGDMLEFEITANRFLHGMVRALVGTMIDVGRGYIQKDDFLKILEVNDKNEVGMYAPAKGLFLEEVIY